VSQKLIAAAALLGALPAPSTPEARNLHRELGRSPPVDSNELFDIATSFASSEEAVGAIFDGKKGKRVDDAPAEGSKSTTMGKKPLLLTQLEGVLEQPLEASAYSTTC
jgi:hypothetical protein